MSPKPTLANFWHPVARSEEIAEQPRRFRLLNEDLVLYRDDEGVVVFKDLCIHRGTALSVGRVTEGRLVCAYHGWEYDRTGACVRIPSLAAGSTIPRKAKAIAYQAAERHGLVWVALDEPVRPIPPYPKDEDRDPSFHFHVSSHNVWRTSAGRAAENFMDFSHFPFVHPNLLAPPDRTVMPEAKVEETDYGLKYAYETIEPESPSSAEGDVVQFEYHHYIPFTVHVRKETPDGGVTYVSMLGSPTEPKLTNSWIVFLRNYALDTPDSEFDHFSNRVVEQDRRIVESQRPELIPLDLREELHLKVPDASGIALRRVLAQIDDIESFLP